MTTVLILGAGYIGKHLLKAGVAANTIDYTHLIHKSKVDYTNPDILYSYILKHNIDVVVNASGYTGRPNIDQCEANKRECWYYNVVVPNIITGTCHRAGVKFFHISSGCIFTGYGTEWSETDTPNFGLYDPSSFYSKTKHAAETLITSLPGDNVVLRIRMPFSADKTERNFICKLLKYDKLISYDNSMTCVEDFCSLVVDMIDRGIASGVYNVVHDSPMCASSIVAMLPKHIHAAHDFKFVNIDQIPITAPRSNCVISNKKLKSHGFTLPDVKSSMQKSINLIYGDA